MELKHIAAREGRLSSFLLGELKMSGGLMNKLKWGSAIQVNGQPQRTNYTVIPGDIITVALDEETPEYPVETGDLTILYEDDHIIALDKPAGMLVHPSRAKLTGTLANLTAGYYQRTNQKCAFHPLTRLDRDTYGVVLAAKNAHVHALLQQTRVRKFYHALVWGAPAGEQGTIDAPIARRPLPSLLREISPEGKPSVTNWRVLERLEGITRLELEPVTGRTHQLRLHCAHMGHPILGDPQYGEEKWQEASKKMGIPHQLLCAKRLEITHPMAGEEIIIQSKMNAEL